MILSDREIQLAIERGTLSIVPPPPLEVYDSTAVDLRLDAELHVWNPIPKNPALGIDPCFCPGAEGFNIKQVIRDYTVLHDLRNGHYRLPPRDAIPSPPVPVHPRLDAGEDPHSARLADLCPG